MDFALTDEQRMLEETLTRLVADQVTPHVDSSSRMAGWIWPQSTPGIVIVQSTA